jgi:hypothetical protein
MSEKPRRCIIAVTKNTANAANIIALLRDDPSNTIGTKYNIDFQGVAPDINLNAATDRSKIAILFGRLPPIAIENIDTHSRILDNAMNL